MNEDLHTVTCTHTHTHLHTPMHTKLVTGLIFESENYDIIFMYLKIKNWKYFFWNWIHSSLSLVSSNITLVTCKILVGEIQIHYFHINII